MLKGFARILSSLIHRKRQSALATGLKGAGPFRAGALRRTPRRYRMHPPSGAQARGAAAPETAWRPDMSGVASLEALAERLSALPADLALEDGQPESPRLTPQRPWRWSQTALALACVQIPGLALGFALGWWLV